MARKNMSTLQPISLNLISVGPNNPRKHFDEKHMEELTASVKKFGILQPIVVRPDADGFELVCGERRYRAALAAGLEEIPASIRKLTDDEAFELQITENLQRQDINAMEESDAFFQLTKRGMTTAEKIAKKLGKSAQYVYDRLALQRCILEVQEGVRSGKLNMAIAKQYARLNMDDQQQLWGEVSRTELADDLSTVKAHAAAFRLELGKAPFKTDDPFLYEKAGSCTKCPKRSGCNQLLFDDITAKDICFDRSCFDKKVAAHVDHVIGELEAQGKKVHRVLASHDDEIEGAIEWSDWDEVTKDDERYEKWERLGVVVAVTPWSNYRVGQVVKVELEEDHAQDAQQGQSSGRTLDRNGYPQGSDAPGAERPKDWDMEVGDRLLKAVLGDWRNLVKTQGVYAYQRNRLVRKIDDMDSDVLEKFCDAASWDLVKYDEGDDAGEIDHEQTALRAIAQIESVYGRDLEIVLGLVCMIDALEDACVFAAIEWGSKIDSDDLEKLQQSFRSIAFVPMVKAWEHETGVELIDWKQPETPDQTEPTETTNN